MTDNSPIPDLDSLLKKWSQAELATDVARDCPPVSVLWYHECENESLGQYAEHVSTCVRCEKRLTLIRKELTEAHGLQSVGRRRSERPTRRVRPVLFKIGVLAAAASIAVVFIIYPSANDKSFDNQIAVFSRLADAARSGGATRGDAGEPITGDSPDQPAWVTQALADPQVESPLKELSANVPPIMSGLCNGELALDAEGRVSATPIARDKELLDMPGRERCAIDTLVDALLRHLPGATESDRPAVRRALLRWRAINDFGQTTGEDK